MLRFLSFLLIVINYIELTACSGLYNWSDHVIILKGDRLVPALHDSSSFILVEYYSEWCGHCQQFAPTYKSLAKDVVDWFLIVKLAVINCAEEYNAPCCSSQNITAVPTLRMYHPHADASDGGISIQANEWTDMKKDIIDFLEKNVAYLDWKGDLPRPTFTPANSDYAMRQLLPENIPENVLYSAVIFEKNKSMTGKEIILDLSSYKNIIVRRVVMENASALTKHFHIQETVPFVLVTSKNLTVFPVHVLMKTRYFFAYQLKQLSGVSSYKILPVDTQAGGVSGDTKGQKVDYRHVQKDRVYLADIISGLRYMLTTEVPTTQRIHGRKLDALKNLVSLFTQVSNYLPSKKTTVRFLQKLNVWIQRKLSITSTEWLQRMHEKEADSFLPTRKKRWVGCQPSVPSLRGYPCSLWTIFHVLSVASYRAKLDQQLLPDVMYGYITNFFGCRECRNNFKKEVKEMPFIPAAGDYDAILWLWRLHNKVNERLHANSLSEDPAFPKFQFPPDHICLKCRHATTRQWNESEVTKFLLSFYSSEHVSTDFLAPVEEISVEKQKISLLKEDEDHQPLPGNALSGHRYEADEEVKRFMSRGLGHMRRVHQQQDEKRMPRLVDPTSTGFSLCAFIWISSCGIVVFFFILLQSKRNWFVRRLKLHSL